MTLLPLDQIRLDPRSHASVLGWMWLLYCRPREIESAEKNLDRWERVTVFGRFFTHALPYLVLICMLEGLPLLLLPSHEGVLVLSTSYKLTVWYDIVRWNLATSLVFGFIAGAVVELFFGFAVGLASSLAISLMVSFTINLIPLLMTNFYHEGADRSLVIGSAVSWVAPGLAAGIASRITNRRLGKLAFFGLGGCLGASVISGLLGGLVLILSIRTKNIFDKLVSATIQLLFQVTFLGMFLGTFLPNLIASISGVLTFTCCFFRLYYLPVHFLGLLFGAKFYRFHPVAWDEVCLLPFPGFERLLVHYAELDRETGEREIERLIDEYPSQRRAALRARAILVARRAAAATDLARLDEILAGLPAGEKGFLKETPELRRRIHEITALQARLDTLDRPFLREPHAALLVKEIEIFEQQIAGFKPPLSTEFRKAARQWLVVARRQLDVAKAAVTREPTYQVFRAGDPVDRECEAFVLRASILGELERQVMLATGCPGLLVYGRRRVGKSTLLRNLEGLLPPRVLVVSLSMQEARAFTSLPDLVALISQRVAALLPESGESPTNLKGLERFLDATQKRLDADDRRLLLAIDEYENLDQKVGEGTLSEDLLAVIRESIQTHRRLIWAFAGSHGIDELVHAPWSSYLVSARTIEVTPFEPAETRLLLTEPLKHSSLWRASGAEPPRFEPGFWGEGGIERVHGEAGGWPHLVQLIAETIVDLVNDAGGASVDGALLERALDRAVVRGNNVFLELLERESRLPGEWDYLRGFRRVEEQPVPDDEALDRSLRRRRLVIEEDGRYRLRVPLMGRWLRQRV